jgi:serine O-acetyltransferase
MFLEDIRSILNSGPMLLRYGGELKGLKFWAYVPIMLVFNPGVLAVGLYRLSSWMVQLPFPARYGALLIDRINQFLTGVQLPATAKLGPGLQIVHPQAVIIAPNVVAGRNLRVAGAAVTIGWADVDGAPDDQIVTIGDNVIVGASAKILGPLTVGNDVKIGPNAMLVENAPDGSTVISAARTKVISLSADEPASDPA